MFIFQISIIIY